MPQLINRLDALKIRRAEKPGYYADGGRPYLQVTGGGARLDFPFHLERSHARHGPWLCRHL